MIYFTNRSLYFSHFPVRILLVNKNARTTQSMVIAIQTPMTPSPRPCPKIYAMPTRQSHMEAIATIMVNLTSFPQHDAMTEEHCRCNIPCRYAHHVAALPRSYSTPYFLLDIIAGKA